MKKFLLWLIAIGAAAVLLWRGAVPTYYWTQKHTIEVEIAGKVYSGSSIVDCYIQITPQILPESDSMSRGIRGEATVVELPDGRYLFGLITGACGLPFALFKDKYYSSGATPVQSGAPVMPKLRETREVPLDQPNLHPLFVVFSDIRDPNTIQQVTVDDFSNLFGEGARVLRINVEMNSKYAFSGKLEKILPWLNELKGQMLDGRSTTSIRATNELANRLTRLDFIGEYL